MKKWALLGVVLTALLAVSCSAGKPVDAMDDGRVKVVATLFPQYDFVREIGKDKVDVSLLLPPGVEAHSYDPTPQDVVSVQSADLFVYTGALMEPWAQAIIESAVGIDLTVIDASVRVPLIEAHDDEEDASEATETEEEHGAFDPHVWTDPNNAILMVDEILKGLVEADPANADFYAGNAAEYRERLKALDLKIRMGVAGFDSKTIIYGGHFAFGYFADRYGLQHISPYSGFTPDAEPLSQDIRKLIEEMERLKIKAIYFEELIDPRVAKVLSEETGAEMLLLHGGHNVTKDELKSGITYIAIMEGNLERLKEGQGGQ